MALETFDRIDLTALFPDLSGERATRIRRAAGRLEAKRVPEGGPRWDWWPEHLGEDPVAGGGVSAVLGTASTFYADGDDWLELALYVYRERRPRYTVSAAIEVACQCDTDHNMHVVRSEDWLVGTATALTEAFESAADALVRWTVGNHDPAAHRASAGLPNPASHDRKPDTGGASHC